MMYYYKRKSNPFKWVIIVMIFMALGALVYWFYFNYFSTLDFGGPEINENINSANINAPLIVTGEISRIRGDVQVNIGQKGYEKAIDQAVLHQADGIKTGANSLAVLTLENQTQIRLGANTEILLSNLAKDNVEVELLKGRVYNNIDNLGKYSVKVYNARLSSLGTKFETIYNSDQQYLAILVFSDKVNLEISENNEVVMSSLLEANEKGLVDFKAAKKDQFKLEIIDPKILAKETWYQWNFDLDQGKVDEAPDLEPDFEIISDSLNLTAAETDRGIKLAWTAYNKDNFQSYKIMWSGDDSGLKYPGSEVIKTFTDKSAISFLDANVQPGKKYYYRACVVKISDKVACGNVFEIKTAEKDATPPAAPVLSASISIPGVSLTWTKNIEEDFMEYRVLKSITDTNPSFPTAGYLVKKYSGQEEYLDSEVNITYPFNVYYRVCSFDNALNYSCSNVMTVEQGAIK